MSKLDWSAALEKKHFSDFPPLLSVMLRCKTWGYESYSIQCIYIMFLSLQIVCLQIKQCSLIIRDINYCSKWLLTSRRLLTDMLMKNVFWLQTLSPLCTGAAIGRGFVSQITFISCDQHVPLWPAYEEFGAALLWGCITQTCNCVCVASSLWANAAIKDAAGEACCCCSSFVWKFNQAIKKGSSFISHPSVCGHQTWWGAFSRKSILVFLISSSPVLW